MTTKANSQLRMRSSTSIFCTVFCEQLELVSEGFAPFYLTEQNKDVCKQKLEEQNKDACEQSFKSKSSRELWGKAAQIQMFRSVNNAILRPDLLVQFHALAGMSALHLCGDQSRLALAGSCGPSLRMHVSTLWSACLFYCID